VDAREFEQLAGIESFVLSTLQGQESFDATEFQASDDSSKSTLAFDAETTTLEQGRTITNDTSADGAGALLAVVDTGLTYDSDIYGRTVTVDGSETTESRVHEESTNFVAAGDPTVAAEGVDILDDASGHGSWVTAAAASSAPKPYRGVAPDADLYIGRTRPRRRLRRRRGYRDRRSGRDGRWRGRNVHESRVTALHRGTGGRDRVRDRTRQHDRRRFRK